MTWLTIFNQHKVIVILTKCLVIVILTERLVTVILTKCSAWKNLIELRRNLHNKQFPERGNKTEKS